MRFEDIIMLELLHKAWQDFSTGKRNKKDVMNYERFFVQDPKRRVIHKATVRDRVVHRLVYNALLPVFHPRWLDCSYSCRPGFGQHRSFIALRESLQKASRNGTRDVWTLKCDVKKFFDSVDHEILLSLLKRRVPDIYWQQVLRKIIKSFSVKEGKGLPIGNLTSQLFANVYLHELDWYVKHQLKQHWYFRYADDILLLCQSRPQAERLLEKIRDFLSHRLCLALHPQKSIFRKSSGGIDWLGRVFLPGYELLRPSTRRRMMRNIEMKAQSDNSVGLRSSLTSYHGLFEGTARRKIDAEFLQTFALTRGNDTMMSVG